MTEVGPRVVVMGPYPLTDDPGGDEVLALVRALRSDGAAVTVVSPAPSAAHRRGDPSSWSGSIRIVGVVRGADRVIWFAPGDARPAWPVRRALASVPAVERHSLNPARPARRVGGRPVSGWRVRGALVRAGAPTALRTLARRIRRRR